MQLIAALRAFLARVAFTYDRHSSSMDLSSSIYILCAASGNASYQAVLLADAATVRSVVTFVRK